jgi:hypothetical protein
VSNSCITLNASRDCLRITIYGSGSFVNVADNGDRISLLVETTSGIALWTFATLCDIFLNFTLHSVESAIFDCQCHGGSDGRGAS